ncbi:MAG: hypothetical protein GWN88_24995 [Nitrospinaceae bacterium]|nr:hypothetical protein [Nitrospinaceae bacterium]NIU47125.1 hypothetical protein [Nitrospinaceae bacterium]NIU99332.1 hypothetical protein [Nitrospinaceae bacterium]NIW61875.1 hypothetical protein [Nitrospinaceae bacterium]
MFTGFLVPFNWFAFYSPESVLLAQLVVGVLDLAVVGGAVQGVYKGIQYFKYGRSRLLFQSFPFFLGSSLAVTLEGLPPREKLERLSLNVRFIEEKYVTRGRYGNRDARVECYEVYADSRELAADALPRHGRLNLEWNLPDDPSLLSNLSSRPARFWELEVEAEIPGVNFHDRFLLPVYARSG